MIGGQSSIWTSGIDFNLPGNGGPECYAHTSPRNRLIESVIVITLGVVTFYFGYKKHQKPRVNTTVITSGSTTTLLPLRSLLLYAVMATFTIEVCYKLVTRQLLFAFNPCHLLCLVHLYLLSGFHSGSILKAYVFRIHLFYLHGPLTAILFPVTNTLLLPGEVATYWAEHLLLISVPAYLLSRFTVPRKNIREFLSWFSMAYGFWCVYHYFFLHPIAMVTLGNLNSILCPAVTDPFGGPYYRLHALWHQLVAAFVSGALCWTFGKSEVGESIKSDGHGNSVVDANPR